MSWERLSSLPPLRDEHGAILLEEADEDTRSATFRLYGRTSLTATVASSGEVHFSGDPPPALVAAIPQPPLKGPADGGRALRWVAAGVACAGIAALARRRRG